MKSNWLCMLLFSVLPFTGCSEEKTNDESQSTETTATDTTESDSADDTETSEDTESETSEETETETEIDANDMDDDGDGQTENQGDCNDEDDEVNTSAADPSVDGVDQNCDGFDGPDNDGDGHAPIDAGGDDCNDNNASINPSATEACNAIDDDCDGTIDSAEACPCDLTTYEGHNYLFCEIESIWSDAQTQCTDNPNYDLIIINDELEQSWLWTTASVYENRHWWLGLTDIAATAEQEPDAGWTWVDGTPLSYSNWSGGQPDNWDDREDCAHLDLDADETSNAPQAGGWNDLPCEQSVWFDPVYFICESNL